MTGGDGIDVRWMDECVDEWIGKGASKVLNLFSKDKLVT